jgi:isocitrate dehydrogenase
VAEWVERGPERIQWIDGRWVVPDHPIIPFIEGDGTGPDIWRAARRVFDAAIARVSDRAGGRKRAISWLEVFAGDKGQQQAGDRLPESTVATIREHRVAIKGPLTTPVGGATRSINVALRQKLDLYACIRPVRWLRGVPAPVKEPGKLNVVIFRENIEDVYAGIEYEAGSPSAARLREFLEVELHAKIREGSAIGIKPMSKFGSQRLVARAIRYALERNRPSVTLVHKGNIMKFTEGAFRDWGYQVAREQFGERTVPESRLNPKTGAGGRVVINDRIADTMFQQILLRPSEFSVIAAPNLNGDYLSDACAAQVGGLGMAPGGNLGDGYAVFEATHGTAPKYAGQDKVNPSSVILSGVMMFEELGWQDVAAAIVAGLEDALDAGRVTYDLARQMPAAIEVSTSAFADAIIGHLK